MACGDKIKDTCVKKIPLRCIDAKGIVAPEISSLFEESCLDGFEIVEDIYELLDKLYTQLDTTDLDTFCLEFETNDDGEVTQKEVNKAILKAVCEIQDTLSKQNTDDTGGDTTNTVNPSSIDITKCSFEYGDLVDKCGGSIDGFCELIQVLINSANTVLTLQTQVTSLQSTVTNLETTLNDIVSRVEVLEN